MSTSSPSATPLPSSSLTQLHTRYQFLQSTSPRRIGPALAFFETIPSSPTSSPVSLMRCVICLPSLDLAQATLSNSAPDSRVRGIVARSKQTKSGGTSCLFNHAQRSHPALLDALRELAGDRNRTRDGDDAKQGQSPHRTRRRSRRSAPQPLADGTKLKKAKSGKERHDIASLALTAALAKSLIIPPLLPSMYLSASGTPAPLPVLRACLSAILAPLHILPPIALTIDTWRGLHSLTLHVMNNARPARICLGVLPTCASRGSCLLPVGALQTLCAELAPQGAKLCEGEEEPNPRFDAQDMLSETARAATKLAEEGAVAERVIKLVHALNHGPEQAGGAQQRPTPRPWVTGCCVSILNEWESLANLGAGGVERIAPEGKRLKKGDWQVVHAVVAVLRLVKERVGGMRGWVLLPDAVAALVGLVSATCDRLAAEGVGEVERRLWERFLDGVYPAVKPFVEFEGRKGHVVVAVALDPRQSSMAPVLGMAKRLAKAGRLRGIEAEGEKEVRKRVLEVLERYDEEVFVPLMMERCKVDVSVNAAQAAVAASATARAAATLEDGELGLFETEDWKLRRTLMMELNNFRVLRKNIARNSDGEECFKWWDGNAELFPNVAELFRTVVAIPASRVPAERIFTPVGAVSEMKRRMVPRKYLEDIVYVYENLTPEILREIQGLKGEGAEEEEVEEVDLEVLYDLAPDMFSS